MWFLLLDLACLGQDLALVHDLDQVLGLGRAGGVSRRGGQAHTDVQALQHAVTELEKERDFYYGKLRSVELLCQNAEEDTQGARRRRHPPTPALFLRAAQ